jgi:hypothetical protein
MIKREDMLKEMRQFCRSQLYCSGCPVDIKYPYHTCGTGNWYNDGESVVKDKELCSNYMECFGEEVEPSKINKNPLKCNICGCDIYDEQVLYELPTFDKNKNNYAITIEDYFICNECATIISTFIALMRMGEVTIEKPQKVFERLQEYLNTKDIENTI